jgi:hypothetical protein
VFFPSPLWPGRRLAPGWVRKIAQRRLKSAIEPADIEWMNRKSITIWVCGAVFCLCLFVAVIPIANSDSYFEYGISPKVIATLLLGWALIITVCAFLVKSNGKRRSY